MTDTKFYQSKVRRLIEEGYSESDIKLKLNLSDSMLDETLRNLETHLIERMKLNQDKELILLDTSIIRIKNIIDRFLKKKNVLFIFSVLVIEELLGIKLDNQISPQMKYNISQLLKLSIEDCSVIISNNGESKLPGWRIENKDTQIISVAMSLFNHNRYIKVYTADMGFAAMVKNLGLDFEYLNEEGIEDEKLSFEKDYYDSIEETDKIENLDYRRFRRWDYMIERYQFPVYCKKIKGDRIMVIGTDCSLNKKDIIYKVNPSTIEKIEIMGGNDIKILKVGHLKEELSEWNPGEVNKRIKLLD